MCAIAEGGRAQRDGVKKLFGPGDDCGRRGGDKAVKVEETHDIWEAGRGGETLLEMLAERCSR